MTNKLQPLLDAAAKVLTQYIDARAALRVETQEDK